MNKGPISITSQGQATAVYRDTRQCFQRRLLFFGDLQKSASNVYSADPIIIYPFQSRVSSQTSKKFTQHRYLPCLRHYATLRNVFLLVPKFVSGHIQSTAVTRGHFDAWSTDQEFPIVIAL